MLVIPTVPAEADSATLKPGKNRVVVKQTSFANGTASATFVVPKIKGPAVYLGVQLRTKSNGNAYRARLKIERDGDMLVGFSRTINGRDKRLTSIRIPGKARVGQRVNLNAWINGSGTVQLWARAWIEGHPQPTWQKAYGDRSRSRITGSGRIGVWAYLSKSAKSSSSLVFNQVVGKSSASVAASSPVPAGAPAAPPIPSRPPAPGVPPSPSVPPQPDVPDAPDGPSSSAKPSAASTGVPEGTALTRRDGNIVVTQDGAHLDRLDVYGFVEIKANNVRITNSRIRGGVAKGNVGMITNYGYSNLVVEDTDILAQDQSVWVDGLKGWNFTARRVHIIGGVDSIKIHGNNVRVEDSLLENTNYFANDPNQNGGPTHNDNIQILKGTNLHILRNTIRAAQTHTILATAQQGEGSVVIADNWLDGAICNVKMQTTGGLHLGAVVNFNKFGPNRRYQRCLISQQSSGNISLAQTGNVMENSPSTPVGVFME